MAVQEARPSAHEGGCACGDCPHGAREGHRRAVARFLALRDELAAGQGLPAAVAHSASASRQWVSEELNRSAADVAERGRAEDTARLGPLWQRTVQLLWAGVAVLVLVQALTALGSGWTPGRTAGLVAAALLAAPLSAAAYLHRARGGLLAPLTREDNRLSTTRAVAAAWLLLFGYALLVLTVRAAVADEAGREDLLDSLALDHSAGTVTVLGTLVAVAVLADRAATLRLARGRLQRVPAARPRGADLLTDESGRGSFTAVQYVCVAGGALVLACVLLARRPGEFPHLPWGLVLAVLVSAGVAAGAACTTGSRPVILSVVRAREAGGLDGPIRTGDDIEIRGTGFVPPGARTADQLARITVRFGAVHTQVPLVPVAGGFANPADTVLTVPVPIDVEPGRVEVQVVTAAGVETGRCAIDVSD
ncbi:hypothetical protein HUT18_22170 [Streptomyces sp. NA04227]|uniref:hypothetical protein n=1 Tax=Streptomyces sp. NA04227 TaxID=2742136 RepID=UPI001590F950|nr:hypothetical protein [Streptomyces sp. NA04227]QKW08678.1 hypothetical protein HUT18_22170 [Streptomyces sp. NA04227]